MSVWIGWREWDISHNGKEVDHMFDECESETMDPTYAHEVHLKDGSWVEVANGDKFTFEVTDETEE